MEAKPFESTTYDHTEILAASLEKLRPELRKDPFLINMLMTTIRLSSTTS